MIVYVESNFILELVLGQEESAAAEAILQLAQTSAFELIVPAFALAEPFATVTRRARDRTKMISSLSETLRQLQRSAPYQHVATQLLSAANGLRAVTTMETVRMQTAMQNLLGATQQIPVDSAIFSSATTYQAKYGLAPEDSIMYASEIAHLQPQLPGEQKCFLNRNRRDISDPGIEAELQSYNCRILFSFVDGLHFCQP